MSGTNFVNATHLEWRDDAMTQAVPPSYENVDISVRSSREVHKVWVASPDVDGGAPREIPYSASGLKIAFTVPSLNYWTMIVIE